MAIILRVIKEYSNRRNGLPLRAIGLERRLPRRKTQNFLVNFYQSYERIAAKPRRGFLRLSYSFIIKLNPL